eukprot:215427-Prorocentrum_minimum.AAC.1
MCAVRTRHPHGAVASPQRRVADAPASHAARIAPPRPPALRYRRRAREVRQGSAGIPSVRRYLRRRRNIRGSLRRVVRMCIICVELWASCGRGSTAGSAADVSSGASLPSEGDSGTCNSAEDGSVGLMDGESPFSPVMSRSPVMSLGSVSSCGSVGIKGTGAPDGDDASCDSSACLSTAEGHAGSALGSLVISMGSMSSCGSIAITGTTAPDSDTVSSAGSSWLSSAEGVGSAMGSC